MTMYGTASAPPNVDSSGILAYWPIVWVEVWHISQFSWEITMSKKVSQSLMMLDAVATDWPEGRESRSPNARSWPRLQSGSQSEIEWRAQLRALKEHQAKSRSRMSRKMLRCCHLTMMELHLGLTFEHYCVDSDRHEDRFQSIGCRWDESVRSQTFD